MRLKNTIDMEIDKIKQFNEEEKLKVEIQDKRKIEYKFIGSQKKVPGHTLFSINVKTGEIKPAAITIEKAVYNIFDRTVIPGKVKTVIEKDCIYRQALNKKSLIKRLIREGVIIKNNQL